MNPVAALYSDGGLLGKNGDDGLLGVYCWVQVSTRGEYLRHDTGTVLHAFDGRPIENNLVELVALLRGLRSLPDGWSGRVFSDNKNALGWTFPAFQDGQGARRGDYKTNGVPTALRSYIHCTRRRLGRIEAMLLDGHPTRAQLAEGWGKRGNPVSEWNAWCDAHCNAHKLVHSLTVGGMTPAEADARYRLRPDDYARLLPSVQALLHNLGYPLAQTKKGQTL